VTVARRARFYDQILGERVSRAGIVVISGPRQVGKSSLCGALAPQRLDWNNLAERLAMLKGPEAVIQHLGLQRPRDRQQPLLIDNLDGHRDWQRFLRKLRARCGGNRPVVVTMLDAPRTSLPTNSLAVRIHPWSVGECARTLPSAEPINRPAAISDEDWAALLDHGGFPEPFERRDPRFTRRWNTQRREELLEDLPRFAFVRDPAIVQMLALTLMSRSATHLIYSDLSRELGVTVDTIRRWIDLLERLQLGFRVRPWFARVPKALRKEPKWFLRDWSDLIEPGARARTFIACHLLKAAEGWTDLGLGRFELRYVRDKRQREVDFLMLRDRRPWFLVAVCDSDNDTLEQALPYFQAHTRAQHAFQVVVNAPVVSSSPTTLPFTASDCFAQTEPAIVPARTLLSQLL
jgi:uncharacterized protein